MKVVVAIDSLKGSLTSLEAGNAARQGILLAMPEADVVVRPLADGGEGTVEALTLGMGGRMERVTVTGPLGTPVSCAYGIIGQTKTAVIEMAGAAGLTQVPIHARNPMNTTSFGLGEVIRDAIGKGCRRFIVGIGGSATNDGGAGMLQALGFDLVDAAGNPIPYGAKGLRELKRISGENAMAELRECTFRIACDVNNPLCGANGASAIYGPQKGADAPMIAEMDRLLGHFATLAGKAYPKADPEYPGTGAAGGMGFAFLTFTNAALASGIHLVLEETRLEDYIKDADIVVTGEGRLDNQTIMGKAPSGVASIAKRHDKLVLAFSGAVTEGARACNAGSIDAFFPILRTVTSLEEAMDAHIAAKNMTATVEQVFRLIRWQRDHI